MDSFVSSDDNSRLNVEDNSVNDNSPNNSISVENIKVAKKSGRNSILFSMDPFYSFNDSNKSIEMTPINEGAEMSCDKSRINDLNQSINLLKFDDSMDHEEAKTPTKISAEFDMFNTDFVGSRNESMGSHDVSNISQILNEDYEENKENIAIENLIGLSPVQKVVNQRTFDKLKKYHQEKKIEWEECEKRSEKIIADLKIEYDAKINELLNENEDNLEKLKESHRQVMRVGDVERDRLREEKEALMAEIIKREAIYAVQMIVCDEYSDTTVLLTKENEERLADFAGIEACLESYVKKIDKYKEVITSLNTNQATMKVEIDSNRQKLSQLVAELRGNERKLTTTKKSNEEELHQLKELYEKKVRCLEVKAQHLLNVEANMKIELELRVSERDQLSENLRILLNEEMD